MELIIVEIEKIMNEMEEDLNHGQMALNTKEIMLKVLNMVMAFLHGPMIQVMLVILIIINFMDMEYIPGLMDENMMDNGKIQKNMEMGLIQEKVKNQEKEYGNKVKEYRG